MKKLLLVVLMLVGCATITRYDQHSLETALNLKATSLQLMSHAEDSAGMYSAQIAGLRSELAAEVAYEKGKGAQNFTTYQQWVLLTSEKHLLGNFLKRWETKGHLSKPFIDGELQLVGDSFDQIIGLEGAKLK